MYQPWSYSNIEAYIIQNYKIVCQAVVELTFHLRILQEKVDKLEKSALSNVHFATTNIVKAGEWSYTQKYMKLQKSFL